MSPENFARLWKQLRPFIYRRALRAYNYSDDFAEDVTGQVLLSALSSLPRLPEEGENGFVLRKWLYMVLHRRMITTLKRTHSRAQKASFLSLSMLHYKKEKERPELLRISQEEQSERLDTEEREALRARIRRMMQQAALSEKQQAVLLAVLSGDNLSDIARRQGVSRQIVHVRYKNACAILREAVSDDTHPYDDLSPEGLFALGGSVSVYPANHA